MRLHDKGLPRKLPFDLFAGCIPAQFIPPPTALSSESHPCPRRQPRVGGRGSKLAYNSEFLARTVFSLDRATADTDADPLIT